jgi:protein gp37
VSTGIEWTDETWNPVTGCTKVSPGCDNCYAEVMYERFNGKGSFATVKMHSSRLAIPFHWRKPRKVFVNSMSDLFHDDVDYAFICKVLAVMALTPHHTYQVLTKRHARMRARLSYSGAERDVLLTAQMVAGQYGVQAPEAIQWPLPNLWLGVSVENQQWADIRIPALLGTPAAVRFLSCEPLLGPLDLTNLGVCNAPWLYTEFGTQCSCGGAIVGPDDRCNRSLDWVIVGGESGRGARPMHPDWARGLRDQCEQAGVPFLFKQWGAWQNGSADRRTQRGVDHIVHSNGEHVLASQYQTSEIVTGGADRRRGACFMSRVGKKAAGRELDGRIHDGYPEQVPA